MEQPSEHLQQRLERLGLRRAAWQSAARRHLSAIARDLPTFDSAIVDACLRDGKLSRWQADILCSGRPDRLFFGPFVLRDVRQQDGRGIEYDAAIADSLQPCELLVLAHASGTGEQTVARLSELVRRGQAAGSPSRSSGVVWIDAANFHEGRLILVSPETEGRSLRDLLIHRGRLDPAETLAIAGGLLTALQAVHEQGLCHGDVRLESIRVVSAAGRRGNPIRLMRPGVRSIQQPAVAYQAGMPLAECDAIAPERIGTGREATPASDLFGLGCVLWELLAGRAPFPQAGSLGRLRATLQCQPPPLDEYVDGVPSSLRSLLDACLSRDPAGRPASAADARAMLGAIPRSTVALPRAGVRRRPKASTSPVRSGLLGTAAMVAITAGWIGGQPRLPASLVRSFAVEQTAAVEQIPEASTGLSPLPEPSADGVLMLPPGRYAADEIIWGGPLRIVAETPESVTIEAAKPWNIVAETVELSGLRIVGASSLEAVATIQSQNLTSADCRFESSGVAAIMWQPLDAGDVSGRLVRFDRCRLLGGEVGIATGRPARMMTLTDCVIDAGRAAVLWQHDWPRRETGLQVVHCTMRRLPALVVASRTERSAGQQLRAFVDHCAFDTVEPAAVVAIGDVSKLADLRRRVVVETRGSVSSQAWTAVRCVDQPTVASDPLPIAVGPLWFDGDLLDDAATTLPADAMPGVRPADSAEEDVAEEAETEEDEVGRPQAGEEPIEPIEPLEPVDT